MISTKPIQPFISEAYPTFHINVKLEQTLLLAIADSHPGAGRFTTGCDRGVNDNHWSSGRADLANGPEVGLILPLSSTAIGVQTLNERGLMKTEGGQSAATITVRRP